MNDDRPMTPEEEVEFTFSMKRYAAGFTDDHIASLVQALTEEQVMQFERCFMLRKELTATEAYEH